MPKHGDLRTIPHHPNTCVICNADFLSCPPKALYCGTRCKESASFSRAVERMIGEGYALAEIVRIVAGVWDNRPTGSE